MLGGPLSISSSRCAQRAAGIVCPRAGSGERARLGLSELRAHGGTERGSRARRGSSPRVL
eukprot:4702494-Prymnesium_polylepis.1